MSTIRRYFRSLQFQLIFWPVLSLLLLALVAGGYGFWYSYSEINDFQDDNLKSMAKLLERTTTVTPEQLASPTSHTHFNTGDDDGSINVDIINTLPPASNASSGKDNNKRNKKRSKDEIIADDLDDIPAGISTQRFDGKMWRVYRLDNDGMTIVVRQRTEFRDDLAHSSALQSSLPLLLGVAMLIVLLPIIMWNMLKPVRKLRHEINQRRESDLNPLSIDKLPAELLPLVESLNRLLLLVKQSIERQQRFIADAAHELRSPLTAISLQLQRLQRITQDETTRSGLDKLALRLTRNQKLVEQLLTLARAGNIETEQQHVEPVSLKVVVEQAIGLLIPIADNKSIDLSVDLQEDGYVGMNETSLLLVVKNLIQNAIIYTPEQGQVTVNLYRSSVDHSQSISSSDFGTCVIGKEQQSASHDRLVLQVIDSGCGIAPDYYENAFEPFVRLGKTGLQSRSDSAGNQSTPIGGTGLGLSIVKTVCEQSGINVLMKTADTSRKENQGLCITLVFKA